MQVFFSQGQLSFSFRANAKARPGPPNTDWCVFPHPALGLSTVANRNFCMGKTNFSHCDLAKYYGQLADDNWEKPKEVGLSGPFLAELERERALQQSLNGDPRGGLLRCAASGCCLVAEPKCSVN